MSQKMASFCMIDFPIKALTDHNKAHQAHRHIVNFQAILLLCYKSSMRSKTLEKSGLEN